MYAVTLLSPAAGEPGETVATHAGELRLTPTDLRGITVAEAATPEDAVRRALTGTITATVGSQSARYAFGPGTVGLSKHDHLPYLVRVSGTSGRVWLEDLAGLPNSDWDYNDRSWRVSVRPLNATSSSGGGGSVFTLSSYPTVVATADSMWYGAMAEGAADQIRLQETVTQVSDTEYKWDLVFTNTSTDPGHTSSLYYQGVQALELAVPDTDDISGHVTPTGWSAVETVTIGGGPMMRWETASDFIMPGKSRMFSFYTPPRPFTWYPGGGYSPPNGIGEVEVSVEGAGMVPDEAVKIKADVDIDGTVSNVFTETTEDTIGGLVVENADNNNAPRKKVILQQALNNDGTVWVGSVKLTALNSKIEVYDAATGGNKIAFDGTANVFNNANLPKTFYVQGVSASGSMRDTGLKAEPVIVRANEKSIPDEVAFTVLWVDVSVSFTGGVSSDNDKAEAYKNYTSARHYDLGLQTFYDGRNLKWAWGFEARGLVYPAEFSYPGSDLKLERDVQNRWYKGSDPLGIATDFSASIPPGNDTSSDGWRDDNPLDSDPLGQIFDTDGPSIYFVTSPQNEIRRMRFNFKEFADITIDGTAIRASNIFEGFVRFSIKQTAAPTGSTWVLSNDVAGDNSPGTGTTKVTWNLV